MKTILKFLALAIAFASNCAMATTIGFAADTGLFITQGYQGFNYGGGDGAYSWVNDTTDPIDSSWGVGATALGAAWSNGGTPLTLTSSTNGQTFNIASLSLDVGTSESVTIQGLLMGVVTDTWTGIILNQAAYTDVILNWTNIDQLTLSGGANLFVTNIDTGTKVPEPTSIALLGLGFAVMAATRRRKSV